MTSGPGVLRRLLGVLLLTVGLVAAPAVAATASASTTAAPASTTAATAVRAAGPVAAKACADAPEPTRPTAGLAGKFFPRPDTATDADPFDDLGVPLSDVYGYSYTWVNYDTGCRPGSGVGPDFGTTAGNIGLGGSTAVVAFTHGLLDLVVVPDWLSPLDGVLTAATQTVKSGIWSPWFVVAALVVAVSLLWAAGRADVSHVVTSVGWAMVALVATTYVMSYPVSSAQAVDGLIETTVTASASAVGAPTAGTGEVLGPAVPGDPGGTATSADPASEALSHLFDGINRQMLYDSWLEGTLGSTTSHVATAYGPDLFRASHLTWDEARTVEDDPEAGAAIIDAKKELWVRTAAAVERADGAAYQQLTGNNGRWDAAAAAIVGTGFTMPFLAVAAVFIVLSYAVVRVFVPVAPAVGLVALLYTAQGWVVTVLKNVGRFVILGPLFWVAALVNLLIDSAILSSQLAWLLKITLCLVVMIVLFKILRPGRTIPGMARLRRMAGAGARAAVTRRAVRRGVDDATDDDEEEALSDARRRRSARARGGRHDDSPVADTGPVPQTAAGTTWARADRAGPQHTSRPAGRQARSSSPPLRPAGAPGGTAVAAATGAAVGTAAAAGTEVGGPRRRQSDVSPTFVPPARTRPAPSPEPSSRGVGTADRRPDATPSEGDAARTPAAATRPTTAPTRRARRAAEAAGAAGVADGIAAAAAEENLAKPSSKTSPPPTVMQRSDSLPSGITDTNTRTVDGAQVFELWRPPAAAAADNDEEYR
ncbi:hypothetical protein [Isoptericola sp. BMS4]|uniref:hypothetical protein n=1 Tax=Isoptericola sp. BMS4 TaxID=2527875 RepID=UPI0014237FDC|nr:hypothetical protein [Isoptericola sp. BMS4]